VHKDAAAIRSGDGVERLLRHAREIDREFVARLERFPLVRLLIRYEDVEPIRRRRMQQLLEVAAALAAGPWRGVRRAARARYPHAQMEALLREHLSLYAGEVHALSRSVRPALLVAPLRERLRRAMQAQAAALAREVAALLYDRAIR
jgi:predicted membrane protein